MYHTDQKSQGGNFSLRPTQKPVLFESAQPFESVDFQHIQSQQSNQEPKKIDFDFTIFKEPQKEINESQITDEQDLRFSFVQLPPDPVISYNQKNIKAQMQSIEKINKSIQVDLEMSRRKNNEKTLSFLKTFIQEDLQMMTCHLESCKKKLREHISQEEQISSQRKDVEQGYHYSSSESEKNTLLCKEQKRMISGVPQIDIVEKALSLTQQGSTQKLHEISSQNLFNIANYTSQQTTQTNQSNHTKANQNSRTLVKNSDEKEKQLKYENSYKQIRDIQQVPVRNQKKSKLTSRSTSRSPSKNNSIYKNPSTPQKSPRPQKNNDQSKLIIQNKPQIENKSPLQRQHNRLQTQPEGLVMMNKHSSNKSLAYQSSQKEERVKPKLVSYSSKQHLKTQSQQDVVSKKLTPNKIITTTAKKQPQLQLNQGPQYIKLDFTKMKKNKISSDQRSDISYQSNQNPRQKFQTDEPFLKIELTLDDLLQNYDESFEQ